MARKTRKWSFRQLFGWGLGSGLGVGAALTLIAIWTPVPVDITIFYATMAGVATGGAGYAGAYVLDAPRIRWDGRSTLLFGFWGSLVVTMLLGLLILEIDEDANFAIAATDLFLLSLGAIGGFLSASLAGILNNLRERGDDDRGPKHM